jgi:hypothetical protein
MVPGNPCLHVQEGWLLILVKRPDCRAVDHALTECPHDLVLSQARYDSSSGLCKSMLPYVPRWSSQHAANQGSYTKGNLQKH